MNFDEYQKLAETTAGGFEEKDRMKWTLVSALGLCGEAGEVGDYLKKVYGHGHQLSLDVLEKELGDCLWYLSDLCTKFDLKLSDVAETNVKKLKKRYPQGFNPVHSQNRKPEDV